MKTIKTILLTAVFAAFAASVGCSETSSASTPSESEAPTQVSPESISFEWQNIFENKLSEFAASAEYSSDSAFDIFDITGDGSPELIISPNTEKQSVCQIYTCSGGTLSSFGTAGFCGSFTYYPELDIIREEYPGDGFILGRFMSCTDGALSEVLSYKDNSGSANTGATIVHEINGEEVFLPDYEAAFAEYNDARTLEIGRKFTFGDSAVNYALRRGESWGAVLGSDKKELCRKKLAELSAMHESNNAAFELCDLNGDDVPEIIVSNGTSPESCCNIYYFNGSEITQLDGEFGANGMLYFDTEQLVFYSQSAAETFYWSLADSNFSAAEYKSSGSIMETGRKFPLNDSGITASLL